MQILVATDGSLDAAKTSELVSHISKPEDTVYILTVVEVPRGLLEELRSLFEARETLQIADADDEYVVSPSVTTLSPNWPGDDAVLARYVSDQTEARTASLVANLESEGITPKVLSKENVDPAHGILEAIDEVGGDLLVIGSRGRGMFEGLLGSTSTKLTRRAPCPVLLIRTKR